MSELAADAFIRSGMWTKRPVPDLVDGWIEGALVLAEPRSPARARALVARAFSNRADALDAAVEASEIAEEIGDPVLNALAWDARHIVARNAHDYEEAVRWGRRRLQLLDRIGDPDLRADILQTPIVALCATGRFAEARELARRADEINAPLTPHHAVHGVSVLVEIEELLGRWEAVAALEDRVVEAVEANLLTPCMRNARSLLVCAIAAAVLGDDERSRRLEAAADELGLEGRHSVDAPRLRLALVRGDRARAETVLERLEDRRPWYARGQGTSLATLTHHLDGLAWLGRREEVEELAPRLLARGPYLEPFATRAFGIVWRDREVVAAALAGFEALGLEWHAQQTRALL
jgi:tetratricopeptide (TPR) repeat protein